METERLILRRWTAADVPAFAAMGTDPQVMQYFPKLLDADESHAFFVRMEKHFAEQGFCFWAAELKHSGAFIGFVGLNVPAFQAAFTPCVEIGWRLARAYRGQGYATEAAKAALHDGFTRMGLKEIVAFTAVINQPSRRVMARLGMRHDPREDFDHPAVASDSPLRRHVLYRISARELPAPVSPVRPPEADRKV